MAKVFYLGAPFEVPLPKTASVSELLKATGNNTGNLLIGSAIKRHLKIDSFGQGTSMDPKYVEENFDYVIIGASNFIYRGFDFSCYADFLEKVRIPCVIIGLGAQAPSYESNVHIEEIPKGTIRMLKIISERSKTLGVRGYFTAYLLVKMGITNIRVIGCPSMYLTCKPSMKISKKTFDECHRIAVNGSTNTIKHTIDVEAARKVEVLLANLAYRNGYPYILQNEIDEMNIVLGQNAEINKSLVRSLMQRYGLLNVSDADFIRFIKTQMKVFFDVEEWMDFIRSFDFVLGTRFHGCLVALLNAVPSVVFVHDARVREMCELLKVPHIDIRQVREIDLRSLYESIDLKAFEVAYSYLYQNYIDFLEENGIEHCLSRFDNNDQIRIDKGSDCQQKSL
ncbi:MAG: polysaccharide pyruvyl transferase family protein [Thermosediminibacteraceae bacterium]|nr:polysaccharide pyruvyl transferase family protein [Thermosediminibacteraceae bacterium]